MPAPPGFVHLTLSPKDKFYLEIPVHIITALCLNAHKYLQYIGWCVLGIIGKLTDEKGDLVPMGSQLIDQGVYVYAVDEKDLLRHVIDPEVLKRKKSEFSASTETRGNFAGLLLERDGRCVWSGHDGTEGMHIIPHRQGTDWLRLIVENRPSDPSFPQELDPDIDINDIQNGITAGGDIHTAFDRQKLAVLKTPNHVLTCDDIPPRHQRPTHRGISFPDHSRYTLQWLVPRDDIELIYIPNNNDAAFMDHSLPKPADMLLHYMYGAAAVKNWGKNTEILSTYYDKLRPPKQVPDEMGPKRTIHDRSIARRKRNPEGDGDEDGRGEGSGGGHKAGAHESVGGTDQTSKKWDEHDVMLLFWSNTKAARERRERQARAEEERRDRLERWRLDIAS